MSEQRITRRTLTDRRRGATDPERLRAMSDEGIEASAAADPDNPVWTEAELHAAELVQPDPEPKVPVSIRLDAEVLDFFREGGRGYQSRINSVRAQQRERGR